MTANSLHGLVRSLPVFIWIVCSCSLAGQSAFNWRPFTTANGLTNSAISSVTIGPKKTVWLKHEEFSAFTRYDGYQFDTYPFPFPGFAPSRIFEGRSGQLWAVDKEAVLEYSAGRWLRYPLPQIGREFSQSLRRVTQPISLIPLRINNVLILLSDQLIRFDSRENKVTVIKRSDELEIGRFNTLIERSDLSLLLTGEYGIASTRVQARNLSPEDRWTEIHPSADSPLKEFQRPTENTDGSVSIVASGANQQRYIVTLENEGGTNQNVEKSKIRFAWKQANAGFWGQSYNSVFRIDAQGSKPVGQDEVSAGLLLDVAVESSEIFFIASSEGLFRYAPSCWQRPFEVNDIDASIQHVIEDRNQRLWFLNSEALLMKHENRWHRYPWPEEGELLFRPSDTIYQSDESHLLIRHGDTHFSFDIPSGELTPYELDGSAGLVKIVGKRLDGTMIVLWRDVSVADNPVYLGELRDDNVRLLPEIRAPWDQQSNLEFIVETQNQELWFGDEQGVGIIDSSEIERFGRDAGLPEERATCLIELDNGLIWASLGNGIYEFDGKRWRFLFSAKDRINAVMQASDESIWVASNSGIHRFHYDSWVSLTTEDGLPGNAIYSVVEDSKGHLWLGTSRGISRYHPDADLSPPRSNIRILANTPDPGKKNAKLALFEATDKWNHTPKERLLFSYRLDQRPWTPYSDKNTLILENLSAGQHRLDVRAMDRNWNEEADAADYQFTWIVPWHDDPRLVIISAVGFGVILLLSGLAINRHIRLTKSYAEVEKIVAIRTKELENANRELLQDQKMRALGTLSAGIAHDFNGILSIIKGSTQIIQSNLDNPEKVRTRLERIHLVVDQGAGVIRAMLGLARSGEKHLREVDINEATETTIRLLDDRLPKELNVKFSQAKTLPPVRIVVDLFQQTLINLISNASDAMEGRGTVYVRSRYQTTTPANLALKPSHGKGFNVITIQDAGYGIPEEVLPRIFEPFFTSKAFSSKRGTGLGLSMVYEMARELKAGLAVESIAGKGSTFSIFIPVIELGPPPDTSHP